MKAATRLKILFLVVGDLAALYLSLFLTLYIRYGAHLYDPLVDLHFVPFSLLFGIWLVLFYVAGLYDVRRLRNSLEFFRVLNLTLATSFVLAFLFFYLVPSFGITPKTNLLIFVAIFGAIELFWRRYFNRAAADLRPAVRLLLVGNHEPAQELRAVLEENPQLGYKVVRWVRSEEDLPHTLEEWERILREDRLNLIVLPRDFRKNGEFARVLFFLLDRGAKILDLPDFFESILGRLPLRELDDEWFLEHVANQPTSYEDFKRIVESAIALAIQIVVLPIELLIALGIRLTSPGPVIYSQARVGRYGRPFVLYKFRTMHADAEKHGPQWAAQNDRRTTSIGRFLRSSHLDELPQLWNILKGDISFVGPRPERPEFVSKLREEVPYYEVRSMIQPGLTGWAQINHRSDLTIEDVKRKLEYDIYYLKNRSLILDFAILLKTLKTFVSTPK